jgi:hypothetical protein
LTERSGRIDATTGSRSIGIVLIFKGPNIVRMLTFRVVKDFGVGLVWLVTGADPRRISRLLALRTPVFKPPGKSKLGVRERRRWSIGTSVKSGRRPRDCGQHTSPTKLIKTHEWCSRSFLVYANKMDPVGEAGLRYIGPECLVGLGFLAPEMASVRRHFHALDGVALELKGTNHLY